MLYLLRTKTQLLYNRPTILVFLTDPPVGRVVHHANLGRLDWNCRTGTFYRNASIKTSVVMRLGLDVGPEASDVAPDTPKLWSWSGPSG